MQKHLWHYKKQEQQQEHEQETTEAATTTTGNNNNPTWFLLRHDSPASHPFEEVSPAVLEPGPRPILPVRLVVVRGAKDVRDLVPHGERDGEGARQAVGTGDLVLERGGKGKIDV